MDKYILIYAGDMKSLVEHVNEWIEKGYVPQGGVSFQVLSVNDINYLQAMIYRGKDGIVT